MLGDRVRTGRGRDQPCDRGRVDDMARLARGQHARHEMADAVQHARKIDPEHPVPVLLRHVPDAVGPGPAAHAGVIAEEVDVAPGGESRVGEAPDFRFVKHVCAHGDGDTAFRLDRRLGRGKRPFLDIGEHDLHAFGGEPLRQCEPDPARRSCDDCNLACKRIHCVSPYVNDQEQSRIILLFQACQFT